MALLQCATPCGEQPAYHLCDLGVDHTGDHQFSCKVKSLPQRCVCGQPLQTDKKTVRFVSGKSPLRMFETRLIATWCPTKDCYQSDAVTMAQRVHERGQEMPWKYNEVKENQ